MKRLGIILAALLWASAAHAGCAMLMGLGKCSASGPVPITTPTIVPQVASYFNANSSNGFLNAALRPNNGSTGAFQWPSTGSTNSAFLFITGQVNPSLTGYSTAETMISKGAGTGLFLNTNLAGQPSFYYQNNPGGGQPATQFWNNVGTNIGSSVFPTAVHGTNYFQGMYPFTTVGGKCDNPLSRNPTGFWNGLGGPALVDPGFLCGGVVPTVNVDAIPLTGARQNTGVGGATTCVAASPIATEVTVTAHLAIAHGVAPGQTYTMQGFTTSTGTFNATYTALAGTTGNTLVGETTTGAGVCPTGLTVEGTALSGTGASIAWSIQSATSPFSGSAGITTKNGEHFCAIVGEYGADSNFPGAAYVSMVNRAGTALPGAPALLPWLNQGTSNFTGYTTPGAQDTTATFTATITGNSMNVTTITGTPLAVGQTISGLSLPNGVTIGSLGTGAGGAGTYNLAGFTASLPLASGTYAYHAYAPVLHVTALKTYAISAASYIAASGATPAKVSFTVAATGYLPGSEFKVTGMTPAGYNGYYVADGATTQTGTTVVGIPLSGPVGVPQPLSSLVPATGFGAMASLIMPNMQILGATNGTVVSPYGAFGSTGTGETGTYGVTTTLASYTFTGAIAGTTLTISGTTPAPALAPGQNLLSSTGAGFAATKIVALLTGTGASGSTYSVDVSQTAASGTITAANALGTSGSPVTIFAFQNYYYTSAIPNTASGAQAWGGVTTARSAAAIADLYTIIGSNSLLAGSGTKSAWGGTLGDVSMVWGAFPQTASGAPDTTQLANLCKKTTDLQTFATTNSLTVNSTYRLNDPGIWGDSSYADFHGSTSGTSLTVGTIDYGSALPTVTASAPVIKVSGPGLPVAGVQITSGSAGSYTLASSVATLSNVAMKAGKWSPAIPVVNGSINAYIDTVGAPTGGATLHVSSLPSSVVATFTATLGNLISSGHIDNGTIGSVGNTLTVVAIAPVPTIRYAEVGVGSLLTGTGISGTVRVDAVAPSINPDTGLALTGTGLTGTYHVSATPLTVPAATPIFVSDILPAVANQLQVSSLGGATLLPGMFGSDTGGSIFEPLSISAANGTAGGLAIWAINQTYTPPFTLNTGMQGTFTNLTPGSYITGPGITTPVSIIGYGSGVGGGKGTTGTYYLSNNANGLIGLLGSEVTMNVTGIGDAGSPTPGPALVVTDLGSGITFPTTSISCTGLGSCTGTGPVALSGTFDTSALGGTPTTLQAQVSYSSGGPPIPGCSACAWTNMTSYSATLSSGSVYNWKGQVVGVPASGSPLFISVRAANGTAYASLTNHIKMGLVFEWQGEGQLQTIPANSAGSANSYFTGLWGLNIYKGGPNDPLAQGPAIMSNYTPAYIEMFAGAAPSELQGGVPISEGSNYFAQLLTNAFGWPVTVSINARDGIGLTPELMGNVAQTQSIDLGDAATTVFCSRSTICAAAGVSPAGALIFNAASQTGANIHATISGQTLTTQSQDFGAPEPGMTISGAGITGTPTLDACLTACAPVSGAYPAVQTWRISTSQTLGSTTALRLEPPGGPAPWPNYNIQGAGTGGAGLNFVGSFGTQMLKTGTFKVTRNGTTVCQDGSTFAYNVLTGPCTAVGGAAAGWVNYTTGDYAITFASAPATNDVITASWTNIISPQSLINTSSQLPIGIDFFGDGGCTSGPVSSLFCKTPGGISAHMNAGGVSDSAIFPNSGYPLGAIGYTQAVSWLYGTKFPNNIPGMSASTPFISANYWRSQGPTNLFPAAGIANDNKVSHHEQWAGDIVAPSTFNGYIASNVLTLTSAVTGSMWEGEIIAGSGVTTATYIVDLKTGTWGASGSTYDLGGSPANAGSSGSPIAMNNAVYYQGSGPAFYTGTMNDVAVGSVAPSLTNTYQQNLNASIGNAPHPVNGFAGARRVAARWAALIWGGFTSLANASNPTLDRAKASGGGCDGASIAAPCFDIGSTFAAVHAASWTTTGVFTVTGGISAAHRPFVVGQAVTCSPACGSGLFIKSISVPPTMDANGEVGATFTFATSFVAGGSLPASNTSGTATAGCSGVSGTGSNCIDIAIKQNTTAGTFGTAWAIATCGENNLTGNAPPFVTPNGKCVSNGIGSLVRGFRIGSLQDMYNGSTGSPMDDGVEQGGGFAQWAAFTCSIVSAKVVQCVKGASYNTTTHLMTGIGQWPSASGPGVGTFIEYGDATASTGRIGSLMGNVGGQPFPFSPGATYTPTSGSATYTATGVCASISTGGVTPKLDVTVQNGSIVNVYGSSATSSIGLGLGSCTFALPAGMGVGNGAASIGTPANGPPDGQFGYGSYASDSNMTGNLLYDNTGFVGNPLNMFFTNQFGGYYEPGLPMKPFGEFLGTQVSG